jgi:hypothetical protein
VILKRAHEGGVGVGRRRLGHARVSAKSVTINVSGKGRGRVQNFGLFFCGFEGAEEHGCGEVGVDNNLVRCEGAALLGEIEWDSGGGEGVSVGRWS